MERVEIAVAGGGASGIMAALAAAETCRRANIRARIVILEKNDRIGKKLLATGNGRCNITNMQASPAHYYGDAGEAEPILRRFPPEKIRGIFRSMGLLCRELEAGRVYPYSLQASSVLNLLRRRLSLAGVEIRCGFAVESVKKSSSGFLLSSGTDSVFALRVICAEGGRAWPQSGSDGSGFSVLQKLGHTVTALRPALTPVKTDPKQVRPLKGVRCPANASLLTAGSVTAETSGEVQFTEAALSGICIFELSRFVREKQKQEIALDLMPEYPQAEIAGMLKDAAVSDGSLPAAQLAEGMLPKVLAVETSRTAFGDPMRPAGSFTENDYERLARTVKDYRFPVLGTLSWEHAQVTAGGVPIKETDMSLQSQVCPGLYLCGELLNLDGVCGGFNLHWAWASGLTAGESAARSLTSGSGGIIL